MTLVFIAWQDCRYPGFDGAVLCAEELAGVPVVVISEHHHGRKCEWVQIDTLGIPHDRYTCRNRSGVMRWFVLEEYAKRTGLRTPIFMADLDMLMCASLEEAYEPFLDCDGTWSVEEHGLTSVMYGINNTELLYAYKNTVERLSKDSPQLLRDFGDMAAWAHTMRDFSKPARIGNLFEVINGSVFDHNMHCGSDRFVMDGPAKKIVWLNDRPHFELLTTHEPIKANCIHCWGTYKSKTHELVKRMNLL